MTDLAHRPTTLLTAPAWRGVLTLTWPVLLQQFLLLAVSLYDFYLAGNNPPADISQHTAYQAAQTNANYLAWFISSYTVLVSVGATALVARFVGAGDRRMAVRSANQALTLAVIIGLVGGAGGLVAAGPLIRMLGLEGDAAHFAVRFLQPLLGLLMFQVLEAAGIACLVGAGDTRTGMMIRGAVAVVNLPLAWVLFHGLGPIPGQGFVGIAWGTACSHVVGCSVVLVLLARGRAGLRLHVPDLWPDWSVIYRLLRVSVPAAVDSLSVIAGQFWFLSVVNRLGNDAISAHGVAIILEAPGYQSATAFGVAAMTLVGQNLGAGRPDRAAKCAWTALLIGGAFMCLMGAVYAGPAPQLFRLFCPHEHQKPVVEMGVPVLRLVAFAMPALACTTILTAALRGAGDARVPVLFTWAGFLGARIPLAYLLTSPAVGMGLFGAWLAMFADLYVRGAFFLWRFASGRWKGATV